MILPDRAIKLRMLIRESDPLRLVIDPAPADFQIQPASVDLRLSSEYRVFHNRRAVCVDISDPSAVQEELTELIDVGADPFVLHPGEFVLGATIERMEIPHDLVSFIEGKSSMGRLGLQVHSTAGLLDPGWKGRPTLELSNVSRLPIRLWAGVPVCQVTFTQMSDPAERPYGAAGLRSRYQNQGAPTVARSG